MPGWPSDARFSFGKWSEPSSNVSLNLRVQSVRIWGESGELEAFKYVAARLDDKEPRIRFAAALALRNLEDLNEAAAAAEAVARQAG